MTFRNWSGLLLVGSLVGVIASGCSSGNGSPGSPDAGDGGTRKMLDSGTPASDGGGGYDGTTGKACTTDADCGSATGPNVNVCSNDFSFLITNVMVQVFATPVCMIPPPSQGAVVGSCDPVPEGVDDGYPHFCDGPDDATSPGLCVPFDVSNPQPGQGTCFPLCTFAVDGSKPTGCAGTDVCYPYTFLRDSTSGVVTGYGFCGGGCDKDSDCAGLGTGYVCQTDIGYCTQSKVTRTKPLGTACSTNGTTSDVSTGACNCDADFTSGLGFCSSACIVGGEPCPNGWACDTGFQNPIVFTSSTGQMTPVTITAQDVGLPGTCRPACVPVGDGGAPEAGPVTVSDAGVEAGADDAGETDAIAPPTVDAAVACPPNSTCQAGDVVGPVCLP
jgi:hypothetical protein